ncbi:hypothetical protein [Kordia sp.]|uniref:hypothetical protein n=1 Tax=Kordia sp. TaxID=1965332 RepID=UPI0025C03015|nr:hypothetical protein [Kordia sp.]MCH2195019.1 hypothetical protein [Kordia sp.]
MKYLTLLVLCISSVTIDNYSLQVSNDQKSIWHELITPDLASSKSFYSNLFGWTYVDTNSKGFKYTIIYNQNKVIGGMTEIKSAQNSTWISAMPLSNEELNKRIKSVMSNGAKVVLPPVKIPGKGKQVVFEGNMGEEFCLMSTNSFSELQDTSKIDGNWIGIELWSDDPVKSSDFYQNAFDVNTVKSEYDNKPYWSFILNETTVAGMLKNPITNQSSQWVPYIRFTAINSLVSKVKELKGYTLLAPNQKIRDGKVAIFQDPSGAIFAVQHFN